MQPRGQLVISVDTINGTGNLLPRSSICYDSPTFSIADILASSFKVCPSVDINTVKTTCDSKLTLAQPDPSLLDHASQRTSQHQSSYHFDTSYSRPSSPSYSSVSWKTKDPHEYIQGFSSTENSGIFAADRSSSVKLTIANDNDTSPVNDSLHGTVFLPRTSVRTPILVRSNVFRVDIPGASDEEMRSPLAENSVEPLESIAPKCSRRTDISRFKCESCGMNSERRIPPAFTDTLNLLLDAARCVRAEAQLEEAENVFEHLISKFAEPSDLCTSWENLSAERKSSGDAGIEKFTLPDACEAPSLAAVSFSPIFKLLLSQPESHIFPDLYRPTASGRQLQELCNQLASAIRRTKRKLRVLQRMRPGQPRTSRVKDDVKQSYTGEANSPSSRIRRAAFISRLHSIWPGFRESYTSGSSGKQFEVDARASFDLHLPKPSPHVYTNPMECPLSLLSFVSNLIDPRMPHSNQTVIPHEADVKEKMPDEVPSAKRLQSQNALSCPLKSSEVMNVKDHSTDSTARRFCEESRWLVAKSSAHDTFSSFGAGTPAALSFSSSSTSPSSCSTNYCGQRYFEKRPYLRAGQRSRLTIAQRRFSPANTQSTDSPGGNTQSSRRRPRRRTSDFTKSKRKRSMPDEAPHPTSLTNAHRTNTSSGMSNESTNNLITLDNPQSVEKDPSHSPVQSDTLQSTWTELNLVVRDTESSAARLDWEGKPDFAGPLSISAIHSPSATSDIVTTHSAPCMSFTDSSSTTSQLMMDRSMDFLSPSGHGDSGHFSSDEPGWSNTTRPPTPDIRRSDLDVTDLSDGTRVLIIENTHLRAGTLYLCRPLSFSSFSTENRREYLFRIHLDVDRSCTSAVSNGFTRSRRSSSPTRFTGHESPTSVTPKKRRQSDLLLHGWQVMQQAVLEVFPASLRHLPPGTRVCAAWSEQLASNLYPGTVVEDENGDQVQPGCVAVDFDDGDHRQVLLHNIRLLPDHFVNLHQLANEAGVDGLGSHIISPGRVPSSETHRTWSGTARPRMRSHSAVSEELHTSIAVLTAKRHWNRTIRGRRIRPPSTIGATEHHDVFHNNINSLGATEFERPERTASKASVSSGLPLINYSADVGPEPLIDMDTREQVISPTIDPEVPFDTVSTASESSDSRGWSILEKLKRKRHGRLCCRSIVRETDGSVVSIGDAVEFSSENDEVYLGEVREIHWSETINNLVVVAAWFYHPAETGAIGSQVMHIKGALFATAHVDENEARCINRRITVLTTYAEYRQRIGTGAEIDASPDTGVREKSEASMHRCSGSQTTIVPDPFGFGDIQEAQSNGTSEDAVYFIAGKYDPVNRRVLSWDPDIEKLIKRDK